MTATNFHFTVVEEEQKLLTLAPLDEEDIPSHNSVFVNELKLSDFKQILQKHNINSEFSGGVLWCSNGTLALKRVTFSVSLNLIGSIFVTGISIFSYTRLTLAKLRWKDACRRITIRYVNCCMNNMPSYKNKVEKFCSSFSLKFY